MHNLLCKNCLLPSRGAWYWPTLPLRLGLAAIMIYHGWLKLFGDPGVAGVAQMLQSAGVFWPVFFAWVVALLEVVGGAALVIGFLPAIFSALFVVTFIVATALKVWKWDVPFASMQTTGYEFDLLILAAFLTLLWFSGKEAAACKSSHHGGHHA